MMIEVDENDDLDEFIEDVLDEFYLWVVIVDPLSATTHWRGRAGRGRQNHLKEGDVEGQTEICPSGKQRHRIARVIINSKQITGYPVGPVRLMSVLVRSRSRLCDLLLFSSGSRSSQEPRGSWKSLLLEQFRF